MSSGISFAAPHVFSLSLSLFSSCLSECVFLEDEKQVCDSFAPLLLLDLFLIFHICCILQWPPDDQGAHKKEEQKKVTTEPRQQTLGE